MRPFFCAHVTHPAVQSARIVDLFNLKKKDKDYVDKQDLIVILKSLGFKICYEIFEDSKNCYSFEELSDYVLKFESNYYAKDKVDTCFRFLNPQSETISKSLLKTLLCEHGNKFTESEFKKFLVDIPVDAQGNISHADLVQILSNYVEY
ncbi:hypothetical protein AK88_01129 [Plasmodium fragile]|uniref:EF-hand domain-containing protein n=1 Tax=Plasmodium fragile TaxID=5857 RepID=A0A0D9QTU2_PLAFR|nr:uncharacterized protein AK88_01129 [Plasmodium fragile]KJP89251.1 hypothetical protein AK88_01129 [Plasmodium fragile]